MSIGVGKSHIMKAYWGLEVELHVCLVSALDAQSG